MPTTIPVDHAKVAQTTAFLASQPALEALRQGLRPSLSADGSSSGGIVVQDNTKDIWTSVQGNLVFADAFSAGVKSDVLYSWEYAQRWANKQIHDAYGMTDPTQQHADTVFTHSQEWYADFKSMLQTLHWIVDDFDFTNAQATGDTFTVDQVMMQALLAFMGDDAVAIEAIKSAIGVLTSMKPTDGPMVLWDTHSNSNGKGSFQMGAVRDGGGGLPTMQLGALQMNSTITTTTVFFFFHYSSQNTQVTQATVNMLLHDDAYTAVDSQGRSAKSLVEAAVVGTSTAYLAQDGGIE
jgi:hypothetical protein